MNEITTNEKSNVLKYGNELGYTDQEIALVKNTVAKGTTDVELAYFLSLCKSHGLNPFQKEIRCYKDHKGNLITLVGRDWMLKKAQSSGLFLSMNSCEVCENDDFEYNMPTETIMHKFGKQERGNIIGAYAILRTNDGAVTMQWANINTYDKKQFIRNSHKAEMIKKIAESMALKKKFLFSGLVIEESEWPIVTIDDVANDFSPLPKGDGIN